MTTHTTGPWFLCGDLDGTYSIRPESDKRRKLATVHNGTTYRPAHPETGSDARLMAASPDLLSVARVALTWYEHPAVHDAFRADELLYQRLNEAIQLARDALAKAS